MRSNWSTWAHNPIWLVSFQEWKRDRDTHSENAMWRWKQRLEWCIYELRNAKNYRHHQKLAERPGTDLSSHPSEETGLVDIFIWTFSLQNYKNINFYCLKSPCLWTWLWQTWKTIMMVLKRVSSYNIFLVLSARTEEHARKWMLRDLDLRGGRVPGSLQPRLYSQTLLDHLMPFPSQLPGQKPLQDQFHTLTSLGLWS